MAPAWEKIVAAKGAALTVSYKMGGLLPSWKHFEDTSHSISRPAQMGPEWMHAAHVSGVSINGQLWSKDPPASSYPACIAVKSAELQSKQFGETFLRLLQQAVMLGGKNIAKNDVLLDTARLLHEQHDRFDLSLFRDDLLGNRGKAAFRQDLQDAKYLGINRFPTLVIARQQRAAIVLSGYQTYKSLKSAIGLDEASA